MNIYLQILMAFALGAITVRYIFMKRRAESLQQECEEMEDVLEKQELKIFEASNEKFGKSDLEFRNTELKNRVEKLEIELFKIKTPSFFKMDHKINQNEKVVAISTKKKPFIEVLRLASPNSTMEYCDYVYTLENYFTKELRTMEEDKLILELTPEPSKAKEKIFSIESFE